MRNQRWRSLLAFGLGLWLALMPAMVPISLGSRGPGWESAHWVNSQTLPKDLPGNLPRELPRELPEDAPVDLPEGWPTDRWAKGRQRYQQQQWAAAIAQWQAALAELAPQADAQQRLRLWNAIAMAQHQRGDGAAAEAAIAQSRHLLEALPRDSRTSLALQAQFFNTQGQMALRRGQAKDAIGHWQQATALYRDLDYPAGVTGSLVNQAKALEREGFYRRSCQVLLEAVQQPRQSCDFTDQRSLTAVVEAFEGQAEPELQLLGLRTLGNLARRLGYLDESQVLLERSLAIARHRSGIHTLIPDSPMATSQISTLLALGKTGQQRYLRAAFVAQQTERKRDRQSALHLAEMAIERYQTAARLAVPALGQPSQIEPFQPSDAVSLLGLQAHLQHLNLLIEINTWLETKSWQKSLQKQIQIVLHWPLPDRMASQDAIYTQIFLADNLIRLESLPPFQNWVTPATIRERLQTAQQQAIALQDPVAQSHALGTLGHLEEQLALQNPNPDLWQQAQQHTQAALNLVPQEGAVAYRWQWQLGRLLKARWDSEGHRSEPLRQEAIATYQQAAETLKTIRRDLISIESEARFSLRDEVEPLYRDLVSLLVSEPANPTPSQANLQQAIQEIDALQLSELEDFLSCNLTPTFGLNQPQLDPQAAIFYLMILPEKLVVILKIPQSDQLVMHQVPVAEEQVNLSLKVLRREVVKLYFSNRFFEHSQQVYDWLIRPFEDQLDPQTVKTLVFVSDGALRNVPMAILHNGKHFLIEDYAIALSPGIQLPQSRPLHQLQLDTLAFGLSEIRPDFLPHQDFTPLPSIKDEIEVIQAQIPGQIRLNEQFTQENFETLVRDTASSVIHLATHGQFSSNPAETFLLAWDRRITVEDVSKILQARAAPNAGPIELLVMSACKTALGDNRATLGLAGLAIQSGARSTIASLWNIDDQATAQLMASLYRNFSRDHFSRAEALRQAQLDLLKDPDYQAPAYWAAYVLVGNWM